jgi:hypothetical protein
LLPEVASNPMHMEMPTDFLRNDYTLWLNLFFFLVAVPLFWLSKRAPASREEHCC